MDVPDFGTTDALITSVRSGGATPNPCCWALYGWSGDAFTIDNNTLVEGLTFTRH